MPATRRDVLKTVAAAPLFIPASAFGANDKINYACIATGGRGRYLMGKFNALGAACTAICDVYEPNLDKAAELAPGRSGMGTMRSCWRRTRIWTRWCWPGRIIITGRC
ncbi:MAG: hypothetical protein IPJ98_25590 [Bryobacterales bacterium]|nr:hypothetical protein [Bryobacterales bacterium]